MAYVKNLKSIFAFVWVDRKKKKWNGNKNKKGKE